MNPIRILALAKKDWREITRDRVFLALAFILSSMMMFLFGYAMSQDVEHIKLGILDLDHTEMSRDYETHFTNGKYFSLVRNLGSMGEGEQMLRDNRLQAIIVIPDKFQEHLRQGLPADVQTIVDGTITLSVRTIRGYIDAINASASEDLQIGYFGQRFQLRPDRAAALLQPMDIRVRYLFNEEVKTIWMVAPDLVLMVIMWALPVLMAVWVVREKETGSIYNINASTIGRWEFLLGKLVPIALISVANSFVLWAIAAFYFHAPFRGNPFLFGFALIFFVVGAVSLGLLASVFLRSQQAALMVMIIVGAIIGTRYSGMFIPLQEMDKGSQFIAHLFPAAYFNTIVEGSFLKGAGWSEMGGSFLALIIYPFISLSLAHLLFHKVERQ